MSCLNHYDKIEYQIRIQKNYYTIIYSICFALFILVNNSLSYAQLRIVNYNIANMEGDTFEIIKVFESLTQDPAPNSGTVRTPDIYVMQEVSSTNKDTILSYINGSAPVGITYKIATFTSNGGGGENALFYRTDTIIEIPSGHKDITNHSGPRATDRWELRLAQDTNTTFYIYSSHFKADYGYESERESEANAVRNDADALGNGNFIIYTGDWNVYSNSEPAFLRFFDNGNGKATDPVFAKQFSILSDTQSPHDGSGGLVTGGMDDRFDFQLMTEELSDGLGFDISYGEYRAFGNDGHHYNLAINDGYNYYFSANEQSKANSLAKASDHLPVVVDYNLPVSIFKLEINQLISGQNGALRVSGANASKKVYFIYSTTGLGETHVAQLNVNLRLNRPALAGQTTANSSGEATLNVPVPGNAQGVSVWFQAAQTNNVTDVVYKVIQ